MKAYIISIPSATDRRAHLDPVLEAAGVTAEYVPTMTPEDISEQRWNDLCPDPVSFYYLRRFTVGELACALGHQSALRAFLVTSDPYGLILEDDADILRETLHQSAELMEMAPEFDIYKIGGAGRGQFAGIPVAQRNGITAVFTAAPTYRAHAYIVSRYGAQALLDALLPMQAPFDGYLNWVHVHKARMVEPSPTLVLPRRKAGSALQGPRRAARFAKTPQMLEQQRQAVHILEQERRVYSDEIFMGLTPRMFPSGRRG